jgi:transcriptional regulator with XRE-family HTH domain
MYLSPENDPEGLRYVAQVVAVLRQEREARQWTSLRLAQESGVHHSVVARAENGERIPGVPVLVRLCRALGVKFSDICKKAEE